MLEPFAGATRADRSRRSEATGGLRRGVRRSLFRWGAPRGMGPGRSAPGSRGRGPKASAGVQ